MTEDEKNLRKFLESDDPAMRRMGLSMAKGAGVPEELYKNVFGLSLWDPEEENREAAGELVKEIGLENITEFPGWLEPFVEDDIDLEVREDAVWALRKINDKRAVEPLIKALGDDYNFGRAAEGLGIIGDKRAVEPLIEMLGDEEWEAREAAAEALWLGGSLHEEFSDKRAVEPLIKVLGDDSWKVCKAAVEALGVIGDARAVEPLIWALDELDLGVVEAAAYALVGFGYGRAVEPLIKALEDDDEDVREAAKKVIRKLGHEVEYGED